MALITTTDESRRTVQSPSGLVIIIGVLAAIGCAGFAAVNIWYEITDRFGSGPYAADAAALSVVNWYVVALKLVGVIIALLSIAPPAKLISPRIIGTLLWAGFTTLGIYVIGSLTQAAVMLAGLVATSDDIDLASVGYVFGFLLAAAAFGVLAVSYARRADLGRREFLLGICAAPVVLASILLILPAVLRAVGLFPGN